MPDESRTVLQIKLKEISQIEEVKIKSLRLVVNLCLPDELPALAASFADRIIFLSHLIRWSWCRIILFHDHHVEHW